ncbi:MAG: hypothetical protein E5W41_07525, partial [Mesorhizobium sp.]
KQILSATGLVLETYSCLQRNVLAQPLEAQRWFAERAIFGTYEGIHNELKADIRALLQEDRPDGQALHELIARAREDSKAARHPVACELAALLVAELQDWNLQLNSEPAHEQSEVKLHESAINLLSVGIKVGTDAYKSDTGARVFMQKTTELQRLLE